jgi:hypothetical protein
MSEAGAEGKLFFFKSHRNQLFDTSAVWKIYPVSSLTVQPETETNCFPEVPAI